MLLEPKCLFGNVSGIPWDRIMMNNDNDKKVFLAPETCPWDEKIVNKLYGISIIYSVFAVRPKLRSSTIATLDIIQ